jgi:UTP--glucose-1-phosphate uridylyltransferase
MKIRKAVIPAAGFGTRMLPATIAQPKEMLPIVDKPVIQFVIEEAVNSGIEDILIITGKNKRAIEDHFDPSKELIDKLKSKGDKEILETIEKISELGNLHFIRQKEQLGLAHAISMAHSFVDGEPFVVMLGDAILDSNNQVPVTKQLLDVYQKHSKPTIAVEEIDSDKISRYGVIKPKDQITENIYQVEDLIEKPEPKQAPSNLAICSRYILNEKIFELIKSTKPGKKGEIQITDSLKYLAKDNNLLAYKINGNRFDIGNKADFIITNIILGQTHQETKKDLRDYLNKINE